MSSLCTVGGVSVIRVGLSRTHTVKLEKVGVQGRCDGLIIGVMLRINLLGRAEYAGRS
jgi:hypothetical protein